MNSHLLVSRWRTPDGTILISRSVHEYASHKDKNGEEYFIDGGNMYCRMSINKEPMTNESLYTSADFLVIRKEYCRGVVVKWSGTRLRYWIPIYKLSDEHLIACIRDNIHYCDNLHYSTANHMYLKELLYRREHGFMIRPYDYPENIDDLEPELVPYTPSEERVEFRSMSANRAYEILSSHRNDPHNVSVRGVVDWLYQQYEQLSNDEE